MTELTEGHEDLQDEDFTTMLLSMPDVGDDSVFERIRDVGRDVTL